MNKYLSKEFWSYAGERAIKTAAQVAVASIGTAVMFHDVDWVAVVSITALATVLSVLTSVANTPES
jgi:hypothetical protein